MLIFLVLVADKCPGGVESPEVSRLRQSLQVG